MNVKVFYKGGIKGILHQINAAGVSGKEGIKDTISAVRDSLIESGDIFEEPILCLIQGGKK